MKLSTEGLSKAGVKGGNSYKHHWTDTERDIVRRDYNGTGASAKLIALKLSYQTGERITPCGVKGQVQKMGIAQQKSPDWTPQELECLAELIHQHSVIQIAKKLHRSPNAVKVKATRLKLGLRFHDGWFTASEVAEILGVDSHWVTKRIAAGELKAAWHNGSKPKQGGMAMWHILEPDLRDFIVCHCGELTGRNVDLQTITWILVTKELHG